MKDIKASREGINSWYILVIVRFAIELRNNRRVRSNRRKSLQKRKGNKESRLTFIRRSINPSNDSHDRAKSMREKYDATMADG